MTAEVDWVLSQLGSVVGSLTVPLRRVNRDESRILEGDIHRRHGDLKKANYVGAALVDESTTALGAEYDHEIERVVSVRIEGLHASEWGHVDPDAEDGIPFQTLVDDVKTALLAERSYPGAGSDGIQYTTLYTENEAPQSQNYADYYRTDIDVRLRGYRTLSDL